MSDAVLGVRLADGEPFSFLVKGAAEAAGMFAALTEAERDALPDAALYGIARLNGAIAEFTGERTPQPVPEDEPVRYGLVIEWPASAPGLPPRIHPRMVSVYELGRDGERQVLPVRMTLRLSPDEIVTADVELLAGEDGEPVGLREMPALRDGEVATVALRYEVAAMRVAGG